MSFLERKREWIESNPLRMWRRQKGIAQSDVAAALAISYHTVHRWEIGSAVPDNDTFELLSLLVGFSLGASWKVWVERRPKLNTEEMECLETSMTTA